MKQGDFQSRQPKAPFDFNQNYKILQNKKKTALKDFMDKTMHNPGNVQKLIVEMKRQGMDNESVYL
jgi:hypothetical protein